MADAGNSPTFTTKATHIRHPGHLSHHLAFQSATAKEAGTGKLAHHLPHLSVLLDRAD